MKNTKREIKFRAWNKVQNRMFIVDGLDFYFEPPSILSLSHEKPDIEVLDYTYHDEDFELMQYTGLKDKNGKEIYESDVVTFMTVQDDKRKIRTGVIHWSEPDARWKVDYWSFGTEIYLSRTEVIGNIYSNPELLK